MHGYCSAATAHLLEVEAVHPVAHVLERVADALFGLAVALGCLVEAVVDLFDGLLDLLEPLLPGVPEVPAGFVELVRSDRVRPQRVEAFRCSVDVLLNPGQVLLQRFETADVDREIRHSFPLTPVGSPQRGATITGGHLTVGETCADVTNRANSAGWPSDPSAVLAHTARIQACSARILTVSVRVPTGSRLEAAGSAERMGACDTGTGSSTSAARGR